MILVQLLGYLASSVVLATFCMSTMLPLRVTAIVSNVIFASYGALAGLYPVLILHLVLLPVNTLKLRQVLRMTGRLRQAQQSDMPLQALMPFLVERRAPAGTVLFRKDDTAEGLFYIHDGEVEIVEVGEHCRSGDLFGEMGVFAAGNRRMATAMCRSDCTLYWLSAAKAKELYFQNPAFGFSVLSLIVSRMSSNVARAKQPSPRPDDLALVAPRVA